MRKIITQYLNCLNFKLIKVGILALLLAFINSNVQANISIQNQEKEVKGVVIDTENNEPIPGVNITIKGTSQGTVTDIDGNYTIKVPDVNTILVFSFIGFKNQEIPVGNQAIINVNLETDFAGLDEVIIVAYGVQKKSNLTGSVASVSADNIKKANSAPNVSERLKGRAAGVQVTTNTNGKPGEAATVRIRGTSTLYGNQNPLWVVDGMIFNSAPNIHPGDIESMSVLKDASSTALYGSRAGAGVIVITTKSGKQGKPEFNFSYKHGISVHDMGKFDVMNSQQLYDHFTSFYTPEYDGKARELEATLRETNPNITEEEIKNTVELIYGTRNGFVNDKFTNRYPHLDTSIQLLDVDTDWEDFAFRSGQIDEYNISYANGTEKVNTFLSGSYYNEAGILKGQDFERYTGNANITYQAYERLSISAKVNLDYTERLQQDGSSLYNTFIYMPWDDPYNADGSIREVLNGSSADGRKWYGRDGSNYLYPRQYNYSQSEGLNNRFKFSGIFDITNDLKFEHNQNFNFNNYYSFSNSDARTASGRTNDRNGAIQEYYSKNKIYLTNSFLRYIKTFGIHSIKVTAGYEYENYSWQSLYSTGTGIIPGVTIMNGAASSEANEGKREEYANQSFLVNTNYILKDKYLFQGSLRYDGSSRFHPENQYGPFYSLSAGWIVTKEDFLSNNFIVNFLKLRTSYGTVGNLYGSVGSDTRSIYEAFGIYGFGFSYNDIPGLFPARMDLPYLSWEKKSDFNIAADFRLLNRINGTIEYYNSTAKDLYGIENLSTLTGFDQRIVNYGGISNSGLEITIDPTIIKTNDFKWDLNLNVNFNKNKVTKIDDKGTQESDRGNTIWRIGEDSKTFYMREWAGVDPETGDPLWVLQRENLPDTVTNEHSLATRIVQDKTGTPKLFGGVGTTLDYKNLTFSMLFTYSYGNYIYYSGMEFFDNDGAYAEYNQMVHDDDYVRWEKPGDIATHPKAVYGGNKLSNKTSTRYLYDGSYLKLGNITLTYSILDKGFMNKLGLNEITLTASADNIYTFTSFPGINPEVRDFAGADLAPNIRKFIFGINLRF